MYSAPGGVTAHNTVRTALTLCNQQKWSTGRIQFDMLTVCQKKSADFMSINRITIELYFYGISTLITMHLLFLEYQ